MLSSAIEVLFGSKEARYASTVPYNYPSCEAYRTMLEKEAGRVEAACPFLAHDLRGLGLSVEEMNDKSVWSVLRYVGESDDPGLGFTRGRCYCWPCREASPAYEGVVDDEEFTSYWHEPDPRLCEVLEDPTGMAARTLAEYAAAPTTPPDPRPHDVRVEMAAKLAFDERDPLALLAQGCPRDEFELEARELSRRLGTAEFDANAAAPVVRAVIEDMLSCESSLEEGMAIARGIDARLRLAARSTG